MERKDAASGIVLALLLMGILAFSIQTAVGWAGTVYIRSDGSISPSDAPISTVDFVTYTLTGDFTSNADGIVVQRSNIIIDGKGHTIQGTMKYSGIGLFNAHNVTIKETNIKDFYYGIWLYSSSSCSISGNTITANDHYGVWLYSSSNSNSVSGNTIAANGYYGVWLSSSSNNNIISGNNITDNYTGIELSSSSNNNGISGNTITDNNYGVWLNSSSSCSISGNDITTNSYGIELNSSSSCSISGNDITTNSYGIELYSASNNNIISGNTITNNKYTGVWLSSSSNNNSVSGNTIAANGYYGVWLYSSSNSNSVSGNTIAANGYYGVWLSSSSNNIISGNNITNNNYTGIELSSSSNNNSITGNSITNNYYGVWLSNSSGNNSIYHNNFIGNIYQAQNDDDSGNIWDDGYPSGGNYWSDYAGLDSDGDGIGDTPYVIDANNQDVHPFMNPLTPQAHDIAVAELTSSKTIVGKGYTLDIDVIITNQGIYSQAFYVTARVNNTNIDTRSVTLGGGSSTTVTFKWNTTGFVKGNYDISAIATAVPGEIDLADNTLTDGTVKVVTPGDVNADGIVNVVDAGAISAHWYPGPPTGPLGYDPDFDINGDGKINVVDAGIASAYWTGPPKGPMA